MLSVESDKLSPKQTVTVRAIGLDWTDIAGSFPEVTGNHFRVREGISDYEGFQTKTFTFELNGYEITKVGANGLKMVEKEIYSETAITEPTSGAESGVGTGLFLVDYEINNDSPVKSLKTTYMEAGVLSVESDKLSQSKL